VRLLSLFNQHQQCTYTYTVCMHVLAKPNLIIFLQLDHIVRTHNIISRTNVTMFYMQGTIDG